MYMLYDNEIRLLAIKAEESFRVQRAIKDLSIFNEVKVEWIEETPKAFAIHTLKESRTYHSEGDVERLTKAIQKNWSAKEWFDNQC